MLNIRKTDYYELIRYFHNGTVPDYYSKFTRKKTYPLKYFLPQSFTFAYEDILVAGTGKNEIVTIDVQNVPLQLLKTIAIKSPDLEIPPQIAAQPVSGELSGDFTTNLYNLNTSGENAVITNPILGKIKGNKLAGSFQYGEGYLALQDVEFQQGKSTYQLKGNLIQKNNDIQIDGKLSVEQGQIQNILTALEIFELTDLSDPFGDRKYAKSQDLYSPYPNNSNPLFSLNFQDTGIWQQLRKLASIQAWAKLKEEGRVVELVAGHVGEEAVDDRADHPVDVDRRVRRGYLTPRN